MQTEQKAAFSVAVFELSSFVNDIVSSSIAGIQIRGDI